MLPAPSRGGGCTVTLVIERLWCGAGTAGSAPATTPAAAAATSALLLVLLVLRGCTLLWCRRCRGRAAVGVGGSVAAGAAGLALPWLLWCRRCRWCRPRGSLSAPSGSALALLALLALLLVLGVREWWCDRRLRAPALGFRGGGATKSASGGTGGTGAAVGEAAASTTTTGEAGLAASGDAGHACGGSVAVIGSPRAGLGGWEGLSGCVWGGGSDGRVVVGGKGVGASWLAQTPVSWGCLRIAARNRSASKNTHTKETNPPILVFVFFGLQKLSCWFTQFF